MKEFQDRVWGFYEQHRRDFVWRSDITPYRVLVSEIMLQQTQTDRVIAYFHRWMERFPSLFDVARSPLGDILAVWQGLGYNRRAKFLWQAAQQIVSQYQGIIPDDPALLADLPGIGPNTAGSICVFAYNKPVVFIETNIRSVYLHEFFKDALSPVHDKELIPLIRDSLDRNRARDWYYALMDYGVHIKKTYGNPNTKSQQYTRQSTFAGSDRQIRGAIIRALTQEGTLSLDDLCDRVGFAHPHRVLQQVNNLQQEELIRYVDTYRVKV